MAAPSSWWTANGQSRRDIRGRGQRLGVVTSQPRHVHPCPSHPPANAVIARCVIISRRCAPDSTAIAAHTHLHIGLFANIPARWPDRAFCPTGAFCPTDCACRVQCKIRPS
eukprot:scaffold131301_cov32-Tisochrysis_lutea.AAC.5